MMTTRELESWVHEKIPISRSLDFRIYELKKTSVVLQVPLSSNRNHKGSVFGGSLYNSCLLACYILAHCELQDQGLSSEAFVVSSAEMKYLKPVLGDFFVRVQWSFEDSALVLQRVKSQKKVRWAFQAQVLWDQKICAEFTGQFVL